MRILRYYAALQKRHKLQAKPGLKGPSEEMIKLVIEMKRRNQAERAIGRCKRILGNRLHSREFTRQHQEAIIGCSILNKMTCITLAEIRSEF